MSETKGIVVRFDGHNFVPQRFNPNTCEFQDDPDLEIVEIPGLETDFSPREGERLFAIGKRKEVVST